MGSVAKSYMRKGFLIYEESAQIFCQICWAFSHIWPCSRSRIYFLFYQCSRAMSKFEIFLKKCLPICVRFRCRFHDLTVQSSGLIDRVTDTVVIDWKSIGWSFIHWGSRSVEAFCVWEWIGRLFDLFIQPFRMDWSMVSSASWIRQSGKTIKLLISPLVIDRF